MRDGRLTSGLANAASVNYQTGNRHPLMPIRTARQEQPVSKRPCGDPASVKKKLRRSGAFASAQGLRQRYLTTFRIMTKAIAPQARAIGTVVTNARAPTPVL